MRKKYLAALWLAAALAFSNNAVYSADDGFENNKLTLPQIKAQIYMYDQALKEFGAKSPEQAADIWARAFKTRNGVMQYSVLCDNLKKDWLKKMGESANSFWIIGASSPWLRSYTITESNKLNDTTYKIVVKLQWEAVSYSNFELKTLTIIKDKNDYWCISEIK